MAGEGDGSGGPGARVAECWKQVRREEEPLKLNRSLAQVLRYSALGLGIFYGFSHQRSIRASERAAAVQREYEHKQELINKAKEAYARQKQKEAPASSSKASSGRECSPFPAVRRRTRWADVCIVDQDPMSPNFDLEAYIEGLMKLK
jgi:F-type H+-transporting ATP synthase subunit e